LVETILALSLVTTARRCGAHHASVFATSISILYEAYPEERQGLYELYRGAFAQNLSLATGTIVAEP